MTLREASLEACGRFKREIRVIVFTELATGSLFPACVVQEDPPEKEGGRHR